MKKLLTLTGYFFLILLTAEILGGCSEPGQYKEEQDLPSAESFTDYYWYEGEKLFLNRLDDKHFILFKSEDAASIAALLSLDEQDINDYNSNKADWSGPGAKKLEGCKWATVTGFSEESLKNVPGIIYSAPYLTTEKGDEVGLSNLFYVKLKEEGDLNKLEALAEENKVDIIGRNRYMPLWYTLSSTNLSKGNALEMTNEFFETGLFEAAQPDLMADLIDEL
jgi:hypothetical protein